MKKLKTLEEFKRQGFGLDKNGLSVIKGGVEQSYYQNTCENDKPDRNRVARTGRVLADGSIFWDAWHVAPVENIYTECCT